MFISKGDEYSPFPLLKLLKVNRCNNLLLLFETFLNSVISKKPPTIYGNTVIAIYSSKVMKY